MCRSEFKLFLIRIFPQGPVLGCRRGGRLVGSYRGRDAAGDWNVAMRMHTCIGFDDKRLADWPHITGQGNTGERRLFSPSVRRRRLSRNARVFNYVKSAVLKSIKS